MAEGKKTVLLYCDLIHTVEKLTDVQAGKLFKHYLRYVNDQSPEADDTLIDIVFEPIKQSLKRDLRKWEIFIQKQRENGQKGGRPKTQKTQAFISKPKKAVKVKVKVKDTVKVKDINKRPTYKEFLDYAILKKPDVDTLAVKLKFDSWIEGGWKTGLNKKIINWKSTLLNTLPHMKVNVKQAVPSNSILVDTSGKSDTEKKEEEKQIRKAYNNQKNN